MAENIRQSKQEDRLKVLKLITLGERRKRFDLFYMYIN